MNEERKKETARPEPLRPGDRVAVVSPASKIDAALIDAAVGWLGKEGFVPVVMPHAKGERGSFSGDVRERLADMRAAMDDDSIRALFCSRGGYGAVHLLEELDLLPESCFSKWLVGFSDITALHALWGRKGVASLHGAMTKHIGMGPGVFGSYRREMDILCGAPADSLFDADGRNVVGSAKGKVVGGNLAVMGGLVGTPFDPVEHGCLLFVEDIAEPIYKVERILWQLRLRGVFDRIGGLMVGQFTDYCPSADHDSVEEMMERFFAGCRFPRAYNLPIGHIADNHPLLLNAEATLTVAPEGVSLRYESL